MKIEAGCECVVVVLEDLKWEMQHCVLLDLEDMDRWMWI
jgi:hypothetical protein